MIRRSVAPLTVLGMGLFMAGVWSPRPAAAAAATCTFPPAALQTTTGNYLVALEVGPVEAMYSQAEAASKHPTSGEVMLGGKMSNQGGMQGMQGMQMSGMPSASAMSSAKPSGMGMPGGSSGMGGAASGGSMRELKVHLCDRSTHDVLYTSPTITVTDTTAGTPPQHLSVATMQSVTAGEADLHYGNDIAMPAGHHFTVAITIGAVHPAQAAFGLTMGDSGIASGAPLAAAAPTTQMPGSSGQMPAMGQPPATSAPARPAPTPATGVIPDGTMPLSAASVLLGALLIAVGRRRWR
jgi:hypothetical protein